MAGRVLAHAAGVADLEREYNTQQQAIEETRNSQRSQTDELMTLLSAQAGHAASRQPLADANEQAQTVLQEARAALARHLGKPTEAQFAEKLHAADQAAQTSAAALATFDKHRTSDNNRVQELRATIERQTEQLATMQARCAELSEQLTQARMVARKEALLRLYSAYADLYEVMQAVGLEVSQMRMDEPQKWDALFADLSIDYHQLFDLIAPGFRTSGMDGEDWRPFLVQRQKLMKERLAALNRK
jgi:chromosome segregation ATPase